MDKKIVKLLGEIGALPGSYIDNTHGSYASIPSWMKQQASGSIHFKPENESQRNAVSQPEFQEALDTILDGFRLLSTAKERAIERIINEQRNIEHEQTVDEEVAPVQARNAELRDAVESLLGAIQGGDLESAKMKAYAALAPREEA